MTTDLEVQKVLASEDERFRAMAVNDVAALEKVLAEDLHYVHANGMIEGRAEFLQKLQSGQRQYQSVKLVDRDVRAERGFVAVFGRVELVVIGSVGLVEHVLEYTAIYRADDPRLFAYHAVPSRSAAGKH